MRPSTMVRTNTENAINGRKNRRTSITSNRVVSVRKKTQQQYKKHRKKYKKKGDKECATPHLNPEKVIKIGNRHGLAESTARENFRAQYYHRSLGNRALAPRIYEGMIQGMTDTTADIL